MKRLISVMTLLAVPVFAVNTSHWTHTNEAEFKKGTFKNVVATNLGDLKLSRAVKMILEQDAKISAVYSLAEGKDGVIYAGTGPHGIVLRIKGEQVEKIYEAGETCNVFALCVNERGELLIGTGGEKGKVLRIARPGEKEAKPQEVFAEKDVQYAWAIQQTPDGNLYVATGPSGKIFEVKPDGSKSVLLDSDENNILSLVSDGKDLLYAGSDPNGLVYRINRKTREVFVLYDAPETEVSALALDAKGNLYAGTAEASEKHPAAPGQEEGSKEKTGRPEGTGGVPIPSQPPENPKPPALPDPNPGEPNPIPKGNLLVDGWQKLLNLEEPGDDSPTPPGGQPPGPGKHPAPAKPTPVNAANPNVSGPAPEPIEFGKPKAEGNAIYRIDTEGFVREMFRQPAMVLSIVERNGVLLVGTGSEGLVYQVDPAAEETVVLAKVDPKQVLSMLSASDGRILLGLANVGGLASMSSGFASEGTYTSPVLDAAQISRFGKMHLQGSLPKDAGLMISTRSGNVQEPEKSGWSKWSEPAPAASFLQVTSPSARFMQYRLTFSSKTGAESAVVDEVDVAYQLPNLAPAIKAIKVGSENKLGSALAVGLEALGGAGANPAAKAAARSTIETITWEAEDGNGDVLVYSVYFRSGAKAPWILLKEKLNESSFTWDTRTVADGRYEIKVVASDAGANVVGQGRSGSRVSDPIKVDNTPPAIGDIKTSSKGTSAHIQATVVDRTGTVASLEYSVDSNSDWQAVLASDNIFDGPEETVDFTIAKLTPGAHQVTLRAADAKGNQAYETVLVNIEAQAGK